MKACRPARKNLLQRHREHRLALRLCGSQLFLCFASKTPDGLTPTVILQFRGADPLIACVIARSETTKQSPHLAGRRLLRWARNDILLVPPND